MSDAASPPANESLLRFENVSLRFEEIVALDSISFTLHAGETRVVLGAAGSGKTTLLKAAIGLIRPDTGKIYLFDQEITGLKEAQLFHIRAGVGVLFQEGGLFDSVTVEENVAYPLLNRTEHPETLAEAETRVKEALQNEHRGYLIDDRTAVCGQAAGSIQVTMRLGGREPFVPERNCGTGLELQGLGYGLRLEGLGADVARHVQRVAHHHLGTAILAHQPGQGAKVLAPVLAHQGEHGLRSEAQFVGDRHPDAAVADIQT